MFSWNVRGVVAAGAVIGSLHAGCAPARRPPVEPLPASPLAGLAGQRVVVLPMHYIRPADSLGWAASIDQPRDMLRRIDDEIEQALGERGFRTNWVFPAALARSAKRNVTHAPDPYALAAEGLRPLARRRFDGTLGEPLASQLRSLVALHDARYALFPIEVRFEKVEGGGRAVARVALLDARLSRVRWMQDVSGAPAPELSPVVTASLAEQLAELIVAR